MKKLKSYLKFFIVMGSFISLLFVKDEAKAYEPMLAAIGDYGTCTTCPLSTFEFKIVKEKTTITSKTPGTPQYKTTTYRYSDVYKTWLVKATGTYYNNCSIAIGTIIDATEFVSVRSYLDSQSMNELSSSGCSIGDEFSSPAYAAGPGTTTIDPLTQIMTSETCFVAMHTFNLVNANTGAVTKTCSNKRAYRVVTVTNPMASGSASCGWFPSTTRNFYLQSSCPGVNLKLVNEEELTSTGTIENSLVAKIYPNPASNMLNIEYVMDASANGTISVFSVQGKQVLNQEINNQKTIQSIDISQLDAGMYMVNLSINNKPVEFYKFIKEK